MGIHVEVFVQGVAIAILAITSILQGMALRRLTNRNR